ncbi:helix-turn-helix transcriptional regulator [Streptococcus tangpeifui]|uniref:LexA family transcriptional regulator n=1 Tax=Streptococcus tangpeifui TaxID=2709400 RepID=UPI0013EE13B2|nr:XRE family transcriptional regulator [Streptococcus sp. ZJ1593]
MFSAEKLKNRRKELGMSQADVARQLGISRPSYFNWENGKTKPNQKNWNKLSKILQVNPSYFLSEYEIVETYVQLNKGNKKKTVDFANHLLAEQGKIRSESGRKLFAYKVYERLSAGTGYTYFNDGNYDEVFYDEELDHDFASWVFGDSMEPTYLNGEVVLIKQTGFDYDGAVYAVDWDGQTYIKRVYREPNGLRLVSINQQYADKFAPYDENPRIVGKIVGNFMPIDASV